MPLAHRSAQTTPRSHTYLPAPCTCGRPRCSALTRPSETITSHVFQSKAPVLALKFLEQLLEVLAAFCTLVDELIGHLNPECSERVADG